jgi:hypothetical protein
MKPKYEKPTMTSLGMPAAWGQKDVPEGFCYQGFSPGQPTGQCYSGAYPEQSGLCYSGLTDRGVDLCFTGISWSAPKE